MERPNFPQPSSYHPKHHIKVYVWIALVVASLLIAINGYVYFLRLSYLEQGARTAQESEQKMEELRAKRQSDQFEGWQTYRNEEYGFEIKYPNNFKYQLCPKGYFPIDYVHFGKTEEMRDICNTIEAEQGSSPFTISMLAENDNICSIESKDGEIVVKTMTQEIILDNHKVLFCEAGSIYINFKSKHFLININNKYLGIIYEYRESDLESKALYDQILSTFRFIDTEGTGTLSGKVSIGPNCPVEREGVACTPSPEAHTSREFVVLGSNQKEVTRFHADANGGYTVTLSPGTYTVESAKTGMGYMSKDLPSTVTIKAGQSTTLNIDIDTGIR